MLQIDILSRIKSTTELTIDESTRVICFEFLAATRVVCGLMRLRPQRNCHWLCNATPFCNRLRHSKWDI